MKDYLLTYFNNGRDTYAWFDSETEMFEFIDNHEGFILVNEMMHIQKSKQFIYSSHV